MYNGFRSVCSAFRSFFVLLVFGVWFRSVLGLVVVLVSHSLSHSVSLCIGVHILLFQLKF